MTWFDPKDDRFAWRGIAELQPVAGGYVPWRLPPASVQHLPDPFSESCRVASGVRLAMVTDANEVRLRFSNSDREATVSLVAGERLWTESLAGRAEIGFGELPGGPVEIWLPHRGQTTVRQIGLPTGSTVCRPRNVSRRWFAYGSSITQGVSEVDPASTWTALLARRYSLDLVNLGFSDQAHLDLPVARYIADAMAGGDTSLVTICSGINVYISASMSLRTYKAQLLEFVAVIRAKHPDIPIVVIGPIVSPSRENTPSYPRVVPPVVRRSMYRVSRLREAGALLGPTLADYRRETEEAVELLASCGDTRLSYVDGRRLLGRSESSLLPDGLHPGPAGQRHLADRFADLIISPIAG